MANIEKFLFKVDANTKQASDALNGVIRLMNTIDKLNGKGVDNFYTTNQKDMDKAMRSMSDLVEGYEDFNGVIEELIASQEKLAKTPMPKMPVTPRKPKDGASEEQRKEYETRKKNAEAAKKQWEKDRKQAVDQRRTAERNIALLRQQQQLVKNGYKNTQLNYRHLSSMEMNPSKNFKPHFKLANSRYNFSQNTDEAKKQLEQTLKETNQPNPEELVKQQIKDVNNLVRRGKTASRRALASKYMSTREAATFQKDVRTAKNYSDPVNGDIEENKRYMVSRGQQRKLLAEQVDSLKSTEGNDQNLRNLRIEKEEEIRQIEKELDARAELDRVLNEAGPKLERWLDDLVDKGTEIKPERGTKRGMMYERAPAIGLAITNAVYDTIGNLLKAGSNPSKAMRPNETMIGQMTNTDGDKWRSLRNKAMQEGIANKLGFTGQEMLGFESNYLNSTGYKGMNDLNAATKNQAEFSRTTGLTSDETTSFFQPLYQSGAVNGAQTKTIKDAFVGAIHSSGMAGREKEQSQALAGILSNVSAGKNISNSQLMNVMGIQSMFAQAGDRSVQGADGGQFLSDLNNGIRQGADNPMVRLVYGQGTKFQGLGGRWDLTKQMEKGISDPENLKVIGNLATQYGMTTSGKQDTKAQNQAAYSFIRDSLGVNVTTNQVEALMKLYRSGNFDKTAIDKALKSDTASGKKLSDKKSGNYTDSQAARDNQYDAVTAKFETQLNDLVGILKNITNQLGRLDGAIGHTSGALAYAVPLVYGLGSAAIGLTSFYYGRVVAPFMVGEVIRKSSAKAMSKYPETTTRGKWARRFNDMIPWGKNNGGPPTGGGGTAAALETPVGPGPMGDWGAYYDKHGNPLPGNPLEQAHRESTVTSESAGKPSVYGKYRAGVNKLFRDWVPMSEEAGAVLNGTTNSGVAKSLMGVSKLLGRIALPLTVISGIGTIASADKEHKGEAIGNVTGTVAGGFAGAELGMSGGAAIGGAIGSVVPILGTAIGAGIGTIIGGLVGGFGGGSLGGKMGGFTGHLFDPQKAEAATLDPSQQVSSQAPATEYGQVRTSGQGAVTGDGQPLSQADQQTTKLKYQTEVKRASNLNYEKENINRYVTILDRVTQLLTTARAQNGIIGSPNGLGGGTQNTIAGPGGINPIQLGTGNGGVGTGNGGVGTVGASSNSGKLWNFYKGKGLSDGAVAGILGNLQQESGLDPTAVNKKSGAFGIGQWLGSRKKALFQYAKDNGMDVNSLDTQMQYMWKEISSGQYGDLSQMNGMTPEQAAVYFEKKFEKSGGSANDKRQGYASGFFNQYHGTTTQNAYNGGGYTMLSAKPAINSTITVNVKPDQSVAEQVNNSKEMKNTAKYIQAAVYGGLNYYSKEMTRL
jgi:hypothetical protein